MSLADIFWISTVTAIISTSPSAQMKIWDVVAHSVQLWQGSLSGKGIVSAVRGPPAADPQDPSNAGTTTCGGVSMSHLLLSCHGKDFQCRSYSGSLDDTWKPLHGEQSISEQEFGITWNGWDPKGQPRGAREGCGDRWFPLQKRTLWRGLCWRVSFSRGRDVSQGCRGVRAKGYAHKPQRAMATIPQCLEIGSCRPTSSIQESSTIMHIPELLALSPGQQGWLSSRKFH